MSSADISDDIGLKQIELLGKAGIADFNLSISNDDCDHYIDYFGIFVFVRPKKHKSFYKIAESIKIFLVCLSKIISLPFAIALSFVVTIFQYFPCLAPRTHI